MCSFSPAVLNWYEDDYRCPNFEEGINTLIKTAGEREKSWSAFLAG